MEAALGAENETLNRPRGEFQTLNCPEAEFQTLNRPEEEIKTLVFLEEKKTLTPLEALSDLSGKWPLASVFNAKNGIFSK